ncbi:MAG: redoxin domain-containing protein [Anaerolineae bacterium]|nr:redoxin domain-containing protein [Anaerolineae bacterium]
MASSREYYGNIRAPEFPPDAEWLNTGRRLSLAELRGKLVLLDFWTYGCINCMHVIPDLKRLEAEYPNELVVIGVHSAKFTNEGDLENIRRVILRYEIEHPVVNDRAFAIWNAYAVRAWPTAILIDPRGRVLAAHSGEGVYEAFAEMIGNAAHTYEREGLLNRTPLDLVTERSQAPETALSFPGKVLADEDGGRLFIADTNHHRIVVADLEGQVLSVIGSSARGLQDGSFEQSAFAKPQGLALHGDTLYVADTENHAIRAVDLEAREVRTLVGDGTLGYVRTSSPAATARLNSPWDLELMDNVLYIAMAGLHQLWAYDLAAGTIGPYAGSGREGLLDAPLMRAALAQPSGLTSDGRVLYFADSEASAVRTADLLATGQVRTIVGEGLFEFGDVDGVWPQARLQHALGIVYHRSYLYVADTYNHKIKRITPGEGRVTTLAGTGAPGWRDGDEASFYEPGGLSALGDRLYVADTNNHVIRTIELDTQETGTLALRDPRGLLAGMARERVGKLVRLPQQRVGLGPGLLRLHVSLPDGYKFNKDAPSRIVWTEVPEGLGLATDLHQIDLRGRSFPLDIELSFAEGGRRLLVGELAFYYCQSDDSVCLIEVATVEVPLLIGGDVEEGGVMVDLSVPLPG